MVISESMAFNQNTSDNLNPADNTVPLMKKTDETLRIRENWSIISTIGIGHTFILGHSVNGVLGTANGIDGEQIVLGEGGRETEIIIVINPNNVFRERFITTTFKGDCTSYWDTTNYRLSMSSNSKKKGVYTTMAKFKAIFLGGVSFNTARLTCTERKWGNDTINYFICLGLGDNWIKITKGTTYPFGESYSEIKIMVSFVGSGGSETYIEDLRVECT